MLDNVKRPYPTDQDKADLAKAAGITTHQVCVCVCIIICQLASAGVTLRLQSCVIVCDSGGAYRDVDTADTQQHAGAWVPPMVIACRFTPQSLSASKPYTLSRSPQDCPCFHSTAQLE
eukprot:805214-Rhodomonas_salina.1